MDALADKVAIVSGANSGIGRATAKLFAEEGAKVVAGAPPRAELDALVEEIAAGGGAVALAGDVRDEAFARALAETALRRFGGLAFNNAGSLGAMGPTPEVSRAGWCEAIETNLTGAFLAAKYQLPAMLRRGGGALIFTSTFVGYSAGFPPAPKSRRDRSSTWHRTPRASPRAPRCWSTAAFRSTAPERLERLLRRALVMAILFNLPANHAKYRGHLRFRPGWRPPCRLSSSTSANSTPGPTGSIFATTITARG